MLKRVERRRYHYVIDYEIDNNVITKTTIMIINAKTGNIEKIVTDMSPKQTASLVNEIEINGLKSGK
ncbi:MAG: hypothetical protein WC284_08445 [Candidimonas sp.]